MTDLKKPGLGAVIITANDSGHHKIWGRTTRERLSRMFKNRDVDLIDSNHKPHPEVSSIIIVFEDLVMNSDVMNELVSQTDTALVPSPDQPPMAAHVSNQIFQDTLSWIQGKQPAPKRIDIKTPSELAGPYNKKLRRATSAICSRINHSNVEPLERELYLGAYKGVTDLVTKFVWPKPAYWLTRLCVTWGLSPNVVTSISAIFVLLTLWLFWQGQYGPGLLCAWIMTFLDTVDGKLARVTLTSSKWGDIFDHGIDLVHPPFWYWAWAAGLSTFEVLSIDMTLTQIVLAIFILYVGGRLAEGIFIARHGIELHTWRRFDSFFRLILARRNPNLIIFTVCWLMGRPDWGLFGVLAWMMITVLVHMVQIIQAELYVARGRKIQPWLSLPTT